MPLTQLADDHTVINLVHALLDFWPEGPIWQSAQQREPLFNGSMPKKGAS